MRYLYYLITLLAISNPCLAQPLILNKGIAGNSTSDLLKRLDKDVLLERPDLVILMVGTNDMVNSKKLVSYTQYRENYMAIIKRLKAANIQVVVMSPLPVDTGYLFKRHNRAAYTENPNKKLDSIGSIIKQISQQEKLYFIDLNAAFKSNGSPSRGPESLIINQLNFGVEDGIHPTKDGYKLIADIVYDYLKKERLLKRANKMVCFGDSITYGSFMSGAGTTSGATYPAFLQEKLLEKTEVD